MVVKSYNSFLLGVSFVHFVVRILSYDPHLPRILIIAVFFGIDKILGLARQVLFNRHFETAQRDVFFVSNNIPDLLSALISGGALSVALIPVLAEYLDRDGRRATWDLFSRIANLAFMVTAAVALVIILLADVLVRYVIAPGFDDPAKWALTANLMRLDLLAILIFAISGMAMAGLQANQHFLLPALSPGLYNLGQIRASSCWRRALGFTAW